MTAFDHIKEKTNRGWNILIPSIITALLLAFNTIYSAGVKSADLAIVQSDIVALKTIEPRLSNAMVVADNETRTDLNKCKSDIEVLKAQRTDDHDRLIRIENILRQISKQLQ